MQPYENTELNFMKSAKNVKNLLKKYAKER